MLFWGLCVGTAEELLYRGYVVELLRQGGYREWAVMMLSSLLFAASHSVNIFSGQDSLTVIVTILYTFTFGVCMYLTLRVTGRLIWAILLHASTYPSGLLLSGGIDEVGAQTSAGAVAEIAGLANFVTIAIALVLLWFVRGRVEQGSRTADGAAS